MIDVKSKRCEIEGCQKQPAFNTDGETKARFCSAHKVGGMIGVKNKQCETEGCTTAASNPRYNGYCLLCCIHYCPEIQVVRNYKTKERAVVEHIAELYPNHAWVTDKKVQGGCSAKRPDMVVDLLTHVLVIEIDENKHACYEPICDNKRTMELSRDFAHRPLVFIRFNPDAYTTEDRTRVPSCWAHLPSGVMSLQQGRMEDWANRLNTLSQAVNFWTTNIPEKTIETVELFYK